MYHLASNLPPSGWNALVLARVLVDESGHFFDHSHS